MKKITDIIIKGKVKINGSDIDIIYGWEMKLKGVGNNKDSRILCYLLPGTEKNPLLVAAIYSDEHDLNKLAKTTHRAPDLNFPTMKAAAENTKEEEDDYGDQDSNAYAVYMKR